MSIDQTHQLITAAAKGDVERVLKLIPKSQPKWQSSEALHQAAFKGHLDVVRALIPVSTPTARYSQALKAAARFGHTEVVQELVSFSSLRHRIEALREAANMGHASSVELLAQSFEGDKSTAMCEAIRHGRLECIDILSQHQLDFPPRDLDLLFHCLRIFVSSQKEQKTVLSVLGALPTSTHTHVMTQVINNTNNQAYIEAIYPGCELEELEQYFKTGGFLRAHMSKHLRALMDRDLLRNTLEKEVQNTQPLLDLSVPTPRTRKI